MKTMTSQSSGAGVGGLDVRQISWLAKRVYFAYRREGSMYKRFHSMILW